MRRVGRDPVGARSHPLERGGVDELGPEVLGNRDAEVRGEPPHLTFEIASSGRRSGTARRWAGRVVPKTSRGGAGGCETAGVVLAAVASDRRPIARSARSSSRGCSGTVGEELGEIVETDRSSTRPISSRSPCSSLWFSHESADITRVAADRDVRDAVGRTAGRRRGVGLDEPAVGLRVEIGDHVVARAVSMSSHGEMRSSGCSKVVVWNTSSAQIICIHVVPHFGGVQMTMSPGRNSKPSQRALSETSEW